MATFAAVAAVGVFAGLQSGFGWHTSVASASCSGATCLPGTGYSYNNYFDCGVIDPWVKCWNEGTKSYSSGRSAGYGYGSASYSGAGSTGVNIAGETTSVSYFGDGGLNLARACYSNSCNDQDAVFMHLSVESTGTNHTITGHAEA